MGPGEAASTRFQLSYGVDEAGCDLVATMLGAQAASPGKRVSVRRKAPQRLQSLWSNNLPADMQTSSQLQQLRLEANQAGHGAGSVIALRIAGETGFTHGAAVLASPRLGAFTNQDFNNAAIVTEQFARAYEQMRRNQSWVSTFATTSPWAATAVNRKGKLLFSNAAAAAKLGVPQIAFGTQLTGSDTIDVVEAIYGGDKALAKHIRQELLRSERGCAGRDARPGVDFGPPSGPSEPLYTYLTPRASAREGSPHDHKLAVRLWPHLLRDPNSGEESGSIGFFEDLGTDAAQVLRYFGDQRRGRTVHLPLIAELERARQPKRITVIRGERGTGRALMAQEVHRHRKCAGPLLSVTPRPDGYFLAASNRVLSLEDLATEARGGTLHFERLLDILPVTQLRIATQIESGDGLGGPGLALVFSHDGEPLSHCLAEGSLIHRFYDVLTDDPLLLEVPPLRERKCDLMTLACRFLDEARLRGRGPSGFDSSATGALWKYAWPRNVGQLRTVVRNAVESFQSMEGEADRGLISLRHLSDEVCDAALRPGGPLGPRSSAPPVYSGRTVAELANQLRLEQPWLYDRACAGDPAAERDFKRILKQRSDKSDSHISQVVTRMWSRARR